MISGWKNNKLHSHAESNQGVRQRDSVKLSNDAFVIASRDYVPAHYHHVYVVVAAVLCKRTTSPEVIRRNFPVHIQRRASYGGRVTSSATVVIIHLT